MQTPLLSSNDIQPTHLPLAVWFEYPVRVQPHHTDYAGVVWHGTYVAWLEEARVEALRSIGVNYADWVAQGCGLPVVDLSIRYHQSLRMGEAAVVKAKMSMKGVRIYWHYQIESLDNPGVAVTAQVTLVAVDLQSGKVMRRLPSSVKETLTKLLTDTQ